MGVHVSHSPELPSYLPSHTIPLSCPRAPALGVLFHELNLHWLSILHMVIYIFQCYSLILSLPHLLPKGPKVCSLHLFLFCCLACRVIITFFLNSIYICVNILYWCLSFWLNSLCIIGSSFIHLIRTNSNVLFEIAEYYSIVYVCITTSLSIHLLMDI